MNRIVLTGIGGLVLAAGTASAAFVGVDVREDKDFTGVAGLPADLRTFNVYAAFDGDEFEDAVLNVGQSDAIASWGINTDLHPGASFFQVDNPVTNDANNLAPNGGFFVIDPTFEADTFVTLGVKDQAELSGTGVSYSVSQDPDFMMLDTEIRGGWFNSSPPNRLGEGTFNPDTGNYETLLAQISITGLEEGAVLNLGQGGPSSELIGEIFTGEFFVFTQDPQGGAIDNFMTFDIPSPGAAALFGIAGLAGVRRRRA